MRIVLWLQFIPSVSSTHSPTNSTISICRSCLIVVACALRTLRVRGDKITIHREFTSIRSAQWERLRALLMKAKP